MYLSTFLMRKSESYITKLLERDKFFLDSQKGNKKKQNNLSQYFFKLISKATGLRLWEVLRIQKKNSRAFFCLKSVRDYRWRGQIKISKYL